MKTKYITFINVHGSLDSISGGSCEKDMYKGFRKRVSKDIFVLESTNNLFKNHPEIRWMTDTKQLYHNFFTKLKKEIL